MANIEKLIPLILKWEGGYVNDPLDSGGATKMGVTLSTWKQVGYDKNGDGCIDSSDIKILTRADVERVIRLYWNRWQADRIQNQSIANLLVDWVWGSGVWGIKIPQRILGVRQDGVVGTQTLVALNSANQKILFDKLFAARKQFFIDIVNRKPSQNRFLKGWLNRLNDFKFQL